ncbi:hypothetical protein [Sporosarcina ureilytica]|uniref:Uncharacterized protein n=1 Tax=Sporosarcina ureilytica TaxID=298596 RepID=A0A1D8JC42_9BACL|nr:hypothetical protein [Sporosarcina ureilytica]AOV06270.1 hypothetical protein BI350_00530 [Sporosarcina ureilytica]
MKKAFIILILIGTLFGCVIKDESIVEDHLNEAVKAESDYIVAIEGHQFFEKDMDFYTFMQKVKNEVNRVNDAESLTGKELEESNQFWEAQNKQYDNINVQLQKMIEIHTMSLLAKEKNYFIPVDKLEAEVKRFNALIAEMPTVQEMIQRYGEKNYKSNIRLYMEESMMRDRIIDDIEKEVWEKKPDASDQEIKFLAKEYYEELYQDHLSQLELEINVR